MKKITILTDCYKTPKISHGNIGLLIECASDSVIAIQYSGAIPINQLIGNIESTRRTACDFVTRLLDGEPYIRGIPQLTIFMESMASEVQKIFHTIQLHDYLVREKYEICEFLSASYWSDGLIKLTKLVESSLQVKAPTIVNQNKYSKMINRIFQGKFSLNAIFSELRTILDYIDPFHRRSMIIRKTKNKIEKNKIWFYSTALTYTNIGLHYEPLFPSSFNYLVENTLTGGWPLNDSRRRFTSLYEFVRRDYIPSHDEINKSVNIIYQHLLNVSLNFSESIARHLFLDSQWLSNFFRRLLPCGLFSSSIFEHWVTVVEPSAVVVGNHVFEGYALHKAKDKKIPTILLQHGVLADYFPYFDYPVDQYIVRGKFFYERLSAASQKRASICNLQKKIKQINLKSVRNAIIFVTTPLHLKYLFIETDLDSILLILLQTVAINSAELIIRVHPVERVNDYQKRINPLLKQIPSKVTIHYSQGDNFDTLIINAAAVITFESTIFLDCISYRIPVIGFGWHDFCWKENIKPFGIFYFAEDLATLNQLVTKALHGKLYFPENNADFILDNTPIEESMCRINKLI